MSTLSSVRPGGKGKGKGSVVRKQTILPCTSRTEELCPEDWLEMMDDMAEIEEIIKQMDEDN